MEKWTLWDLKGFSSRIKSGRFIGGARNGIETHFLLQTELMHGFSSSPENSTLHCWGIATKIFWRNYLRSRKNFTRKSSTFSIVFLWKVNCREKGELSKKTSNPSIYWVSLYCRGFCWIRHFDRRWDNSSWVWSSNPFVSLPSVCSIETNAFTEER